MTYVLLACQVLLLSVFAVSALSKLRSRATWSGFVRWVAGLRLVPARLARAASIATIGLESAIVLLLALPTTVPIGFALSGVLLVVLTTGIVVVLRRGTRTTCRCFGSSEVLLGRRHVVRNGVLLAVAALGGVSVMSVSASPAAHPGGLATAALTGLIGALVLVLLDEIVELFTEPALGTNQRDQGSA